MQETASTADSLGSLQVKYKISRSLFRPASSERRSEFEIDYNIHLYNRTIPIQEFETFSVNLGIGKCGNVCGDRVRRQNPPGNNVTNFTKSHDFNWTRLAK